VTKGQIQGAKNDTFFKENQPGKQFGVNQKNGK